VTYAQETNFDLQN